ncbi:hypothetical protein DH2020_008155 [Rehmannia glutinosa]|uniref:Inhibitor I9 domain-containing protein n=1 Tax=Rehmannia glutinosa TaxID=99300 RepID=A0ABR0U125_REHGL
MDPSSVAPSTPLPTHHVKSFVTVLLDNTNYLTWKTQILNYFVFTDLTGYIDGTISKPSNDNNLSSLPNWTRFDRFVIAWTMLTASAHIITLMAAIAGVLLSLAWGIANQLGWVASPVVLIAFSFISYFTSTLLADSYRCRAHSMVPETILTWMSFEACNRMPPTASAASPSNGDQRNDHADLVSSFTERKNDVLHTYINGFLGFAARLTEAEAKSLAGRPRVVSVFPDRVFQLQTTRSWDFLEEQMMNVKSIPTPSSPDDDGADTIIGFLDSGQNISALLLLII